MYCLLKGLGTLLNHVKKVRFLLHVKINSKWTHNLNAKGEPLKKTRRKYRWLFLYLWYQDSLLNIIAKQQS